MGRKMSFPSLFKRAKVGALSSQSAAWGWPSCNHPRTLSFRSEQPRRKTASSPYLETSESWFTNSSSTEELASDSFSTSSDGADCPCAAGGPSTEALIRALRSDPADRLFFEPGGTSSILEECKLPAAGGGCPFEDSVALAVESHDPYWDFRLSMEEMVAAHGVRDWGCLEELLELYLRMNGKKMHGLILGAFVDLLLDLSESPPCRFVSSRSLCDECGAED